MTAIVFGPPGLAALWRAELPQKDELCGAFWGSLALRSLGVGDLDGEPVDQDLVAREAGTTLSDTDPAQWVPPGASPRGDYRLSLPLAEDEATAGTAAPTLARAIDRCSGGGVRAVSVAGPWEEGRVVQLLEELAALTDRVVPVANVGTRALWGARPDPALLLDVLAGREAASPPPPDWDVGHFVGIALLVRGLGGALVGIRDTYPALGAGGYHMQPAAALAAALRRGVGIEGGILLVTYAPEAARLEAQLDALGFELRDWDNGSVPAAQNLG